MWIYYEKSKHLKWKVKQKYVTYKLFCNTESWVTNQPQAAESFLTN